jgi:Glycosyltransferase
MKILLVIDLFDDENNGTTMAARRMARFLSERGNEVSVVSTGAAGPGKYVVPELRSPAVVRAIIHGHGMRIARPDRRVLALAIAEADVVHVMMPFFLGRKACKVARCMGVPCTAAFHVQPENITYNIGLRNARFLPRIVYQLFLLGFYRGVGHIHCPSSFIAGQLEKHGYRARLHVISNGVDPAFRYGKREKSGYLAGKFVVVMIGRLASEKRQDLLIDAVGKSRHAEEIQLVLAGQGPKLARYRRRGVRLANQPHIEFYSQDSLRELLSMSDLYVHASDVEIEAVACIEAIASGLVPVISDSPLSAASQFALDGRSLFKAGDSADLAAKIDYWIEHPEERRAGELRYAERGRGYDIGACAARMEEMFREAIADSGSEAR